MRGNDAQVLVLTVLADGPLHGYAINTAIECLTGEKLGPGSLYGALTRLEGRGLIEPAPKNGRQQPVRLTAAGRTGLRSELERMAAISRLGLRSLGAEPA